MRSRSSLLLALLGSALLVLPAACGDQAPQVKADIEPAGDGDKVAATPSAEEEEAEPVCPHVGPPAVDPSGFPACPSCSAGGAHCVPNALLPPDSLDDLEDCDDSSQCVPDLIITTRGEYIPKTCTSALGSEGRCLSRCLPAFSGDKADALPQDICDPADVCAPCFDPFSGDNTGACDQSCDPGPSDAEAKPLATCCGGEGVCLPTSEVGDKAADLSQDTCPQHEADNVCVPTPFLEADYKPMSCVDTQLFGDDLPGVCLPGCLPAVQGLLASLTLDQEGCADNWKCAPCEHPLTGKPTGACDL